MKNVLLVGCGGAAGAMLRYGITLLFKVVGRGGDAADGLLNGAADGLLNGAAESGADGLLNGAAGHAADGLLNGAAGHAADGLLNGAAATFATNSLGCLLMGILVSVCPTGSWQLMLTVGLCGGFTTYSTFSMQSVTMLQQGRYALATLYALGTVLCCIAFAALGCWIGSRWRG